MGRAGTHWKKPFKVTGTVTYTQIIAHYNDYIFPFYLQTHTSAVKEAEDARGKLLFIIDTVDLLTVHTCSLIMCIHFILLSVECIAYQERCLIK